MKHGEKLSFEEIYEQNKKRIHYHINKLGIQGSKEDYYQEGLFVLWNAYEKYDPDKGALSTYFNYAIRNRLIDIIRKRTRDQYNDDLYSHEERVRMDHGNRYCRNSQVIPDSANIFIKDTSLWLQVKSQLTEKQWKWVEGFIIQDMSVKDIAQQENVSTEAVKSWGKQVRKKLRDEKFKEVVQEYSLD